MAFNVEANLKIDQPKEGPPESWMLNIRVTEKSLGIGVSFLIQEPYIFSHETWSKFIVEDEGVLSFYQGNGEGSLRKENEQLTMVANPSGAGGDVCSTVTIDFDSVKKPLLCAINDAQTQGLFDL